MITILKRDPGQKLPRPFVRAVDWSEAEEILKAWASHNGGLSYIGDVAIEVSHLDTEEPVYTHTIRPDLLDRVEFFAFTEIH